MDILSFAKIDSHAHVFRANAPMIRARRYTPKKNALLADYLTNLNDLGCSKGVLIQPSFLGTDNSFLIQSIKQVANRLKGVAVVDPDISWQQLVQLDKAQIVGIRLNVIDGIQPDLRTTIWRNLLDSIKKLNWHVEIHTRSNQLFNLVEQLINNDIRVVVDHFGRPVNYRLTEDAGFQQLMKLSASGLLWCKLSGIYRITHSKVQNQLFVSEAMPLLLENFGVQRLMWGSDWPHTQYENEINKIYLQEQLSAMFADIQQARTVLWDTPAQFFGFND